MSGIAFGVQHITRRANERLQEAKGNAIRCLSQRMKIMTALPGISRRQALTIAARVAGASVTGAAVVVGRSTPAQAAKVSQKIVKYQDTPKGEQRCENCVQFEAPSSCKTVDGTVAAQGWCMVYAKKPA